MPRRKRIYKLRMYRLPDGTLFFNAGLFDGSGNHWGHIRHATEDRLIFKVHPRSLLEESVLVPWDQEPWRWSDYSFNGEPRTRLGNSTLMVGTKRKDKEMTDPTENIRRQRLAEINAEPGSRAALEAEHGRVWDTDQLADEFQVLGFLAPIIAVRRRSDGQKGSLEFQHNPRFYFGFRPHEA